MSLQVDAPPFMHEPIEDSVSQRHASREHTNVYAGMQVHNFDKNFGLVMSCR
jgi:hypothetical protein